MLQTIAAKSNVHSRVKIFIVLLCVIMLPMLWLAISLIPLTTYTTDFSWQAFNAIEPGTKLILVRQTLGEPFEKRDVHYRIVYSYPELQLSITLDNLEPNYYFVTEVRENNIKSGIHKGMREDEVHKILGRPPAKEIAPHFETWLYSKPLWGGHFYFVAITLDTQEGVVVQKIADYFYD